MTDRKMILVTGGTGNTGSRIAKRLNELNYPVRIASRGDASVEGVATEHVRFDWADETTYGPALENVHRLYLVAPVLVADPAAQMLAFLDRALNSGVRRVVLLSSSAVPEGGPVFGEVHRAIRERAPEWAVLQPSWFMQNFIGAHAVTINSEGVILTATGNGRVGFVDAEDISRVAVRALIDETPHNTAHVITGPEALSYDEVADIIGAASGRRIKHVPVTSEEMREMMVKAGMPEDYATFLTSLEEKIKNGSEDRVTDTVQRVTGHAPRSLAEFAAAHAAVWRQN